MTQDEANGLSIQLARLGEGLAGISHNQDRQEQALIELFTEFRGVSVKLTGIDTVVRMSTAEQRRLNTKMEQDICDLEEGQSIMREGLGIRMRGIERRLAYFAGGLACLLVVFDLALRFGIKQFGG